MFTRQRVFFLCVVLCCLGILYPLWLPLGTGLILAFLCEGIADVMMRKLRIRGQRGHWVVAFALVTGVQFLFIAPLLLLSWSASLELVRFWAGISANASVADTGLHVLQWLDLKLTPLLQSLELPFTLVDLQGRIRESIQPLLKNVAMYIGGALSSTPELMLFGFITWMAWIYFLVHGREQRQKLLPQLFPWREERDMMAATLGDVLRAMVLTSIVLSLVQSLLVLFSLGVMGVPKFYLWGALSFFLSFVPVVGTAPVMLSAAVYLFYQDRSLAGIFVIVMAFVIGLTDNVIRPLLMKGGSEMSFFWLFLSLIGGIAVFGLPGAILGPWAFSLFITVQARYPAQT